jgi:hypothetical protein
LVADETRAAPESTDLGVLTAWLRGVARAGISDDDLALKLAEGLYYEAQVTLGPKAPDTDPDFFSEAAQRQYGEAPAEWAARTLRGLRTNLSDAEAAQAAARGVQRALGL